MQGRETEGHRADALANAEPGGFDAIRPDSASGTYCLENQGLTASRILSILYLIRYCVYRAPGVLPGIWRRAEQAAGAGEEVGGEETG